MTAAGVLGKRIDRRSREYKASIGMYVSKGRGRGRGRDVGRGSGDARSKAAMAQHYSHMRNNNMLASEGLVTGGRKGQGKGRGRGGGNGAGDLLLVDDDDDGGIPLGFDVKMDACESLDCAIEWFHFQCVGLERDPPDPWYCADCVSSGAGK